MFDPEKVERRIVQVDSSGGPNWVRASDYDQLLELYRKQQQFAYDGRNPDIDVDALPTIDEMKGLLSKQPFDDKVATLRD